VQPRVQPSAEVFALSEGYDTNQPHQVTSIKGTIRKEHCSDNIQHKNWAAAVLGRKYTVLPSSLSISSLVRKTQPNNTIAILSVH